MSNPVELSGRRSGGTYASGRTAGQLPGLDIAEAKSWQHYLESALCFHSAQSRRLTVEHKLRVTDLQVLEFLAGSGTNSARMGDLADALALMPTHLTKRISRLTENGLVRREPSPDDRRGVLAVITDGGRELAAQAISTYTHGVRTQLIGSLSRPQVVALEQNCRRISIAQDRSGPKLPLRQLPGLDDTEVRCWRQFVKSSQLVLSSMDNTLMDTHQLSLPDVLVLYVLATADGSARMNQLAESLMVIPSRMTQQVSRLESRGLVSRTPSPGDRRGVVADITGMGRARVRPALETYAKLVRTLYLDSLSRQQMIALGDICRRIGAP